MKLVIPIEEKNINADVCQSFGRTPYFVVYDTDTKNYDFIDNNAVSSQGGAGIKAAQNIVNKGVDAVLTFRCGENAATVLNGAGVKIYRIFDISVEKNIDDFINGKLSILDNIHPGFHNHGN